MDNLPAQATFVEITFAVNLLFAVYKNVRDFLGWSLKRQVKEYQASIQTIEAPADLARLNALSEKVSRYSTKCLNAQGIFVLLATIASLLAATGCTAVVYWNLLDQLGHRTAWLLIPLPLYCLATLLNLGIFRCRSWRQVSRVRNFCKDYPAEPPAVPPELRP